MPGARCTRSLVRDSAMTWSSSGTQCLSFVVLQPTIGVEEHVRGELLVTVNISNGQTNARPGISRSSNMFDVLESSFGDKVGCLMDQDGHSLQRPKIQIKRRDMDSVHPGRVGDESGRRRELGETRVLLRSRRSAMKLRSGRLITSSIRV